LRGEDGSPKPNGVGLGRKASPKLHDDPPKKEGKRKRRNGKERRRNKGERGGKNRDTVGIQMAVKQ